MKRWVRSLRQRDLVAWVITIAVAIIAVGLILAAAGHLDQSPVLEGIGLFIALAAMVSGVAVVGLFVCSG
jgi:hypothetical protein